MVIWSNAKVLKSPKMLPFIGQRDFETLRAIGNFLNTVPFDATGNLVWPFKHSLMFTEEVREPAIPVSTGLLKRANEIWKESKDPVTVLCGGDIDSLAVLAALMQTAPTVNKVRVHYTDASVNRYPALFTEILPSKGIETLDCTGKALITSDVIRYCDGRSGDDFQASYKDYLDMVIPEEVRQGGMEEVIDIVAGHALGRENNQRLAKEGLKKWVRQHPYSIKTSWQFIIHLHRSMYTQSSAWAGVLLEGDTQAAFNKRVPFFDAPLFSGVTRYLAENEDWPDNETIGMKRFVYDYFKDKDWYDKPGLIDIHSLIKPGKIASRWLDNEGHSYGFREFENKNL